MRNPFRKLFMKGYRALVLDSDGVYADKNQELAVVAPDERNWKGIGIAVLVIGAVCSLIVTAVILLTPDEVGRVTKPRIRLKEIVDFEFSPRRFNGSWISNNELLYRDGDGNLIIHDVQDNIPRHFVSYKTFNEHRATSFSLSKDGRYIAFETATKKIFRYSHASIYKIYDTETRKIFTLRTPSKKRDQRAVLFKWGPVKNSMIFVHRNDIYYLSSVEDASQNISKRLTQNGRPGIIFNGVPDWLYEEEIFASNSAVWWSPNGRFLCYASFNDSLVRSISYPYYGNISDMQHTYPGTFNVKYPKPGSSNPSVTLWVIDLQQTKVTIPIFVRPPLSIADRDHYITAVSWINDRSLSVSWMRRSQNYSVISSCKGSLVYWNCLTTQEVRASGAPDGKSWVELYSNPIYSASGDKYFVKLPVADGKAGEFPNVAKVMTESQHRTFVTHGRFDVTEILAYSEELRRVYYISTADGKPGQRHLFSVSEETTLHPQRPKCLTCDLGNECLYNNAIFSPDTKYYVLECLGPRVPYIAVYSTTENISLFLLDNNDEIQNRIDNRAMPQVMRYNVPLSNGFNAEVRLLLPPDYRSTDVIKYPLLVFVYGGPNSQVVSQKFEVTWGSYLASRKSIIVASIDARGSGFQGDRMVNQLYKQLGDVEVDDQIAVTRYLTENVPFIDSEHVAIWGWSYGGYVTAMALMSESQNVFQCGISVAPVTSWIYYDSFYTERYMQTPVENKQGYEKADALLKAPNLREKKFFLIHGSADDNVHFQQSMLLAKALNRAGIMYKMQVYPDENHFLGGVKRHLYDSMENFLDYCFPEEQLDTYALKQLRK